MLQTSMCNLYHSTPRDHIEPVFKASAPAKAYGAVIAPLKDGPYIKADGVCEVGQWGMIPPDSRTHVPTSKQTGRRLSTNNARVETVAKAWTYRFPWQHGQRCLIAADSYDEPYYPDGVKNVWWRFRRADGQPWALAGLWAYWTDPETGEVLPSYTMLTRNCDAHPLLSRFHKPERDPVTKEILPPEKQDKRSVVPIEAADWDAWLHGSVEQATGLFRLPPVEAFLHEAADPARQVDFPI